jgi:hypothetical protein
VKKTVDAYPTLHAQAEVGLPGKESGRRWAKALGRPMVFGQWSAQPF